MDNIAKYTFDPQNPRDFKAYDLIKMIIKEDNYFVLIDPYFLSEIFCDVVWDNEGNDKIWDKPDNFDELSGIEKARLFVENRNFDDYLDFLFSKINPIFKNSIFNNLFTKNIINEGLFVDFDHFSYLQYFKLSNDEKISHLKYWEHESEFKKNWILLLSDEFVFLRQHISSPKTALLITYCDVYDELFGAGFTLSNNKYSKIKTFKHNILLQKSKHVNILINLLYANLNSEKAKKSVKNDNFSYLEKVQIKNYFSIQEFQSENFSKNKETYFLGENGEGKTILLQAILLALKGNTGNEYVFKTIKENNDFNRELNRGELVLTANDIYVFKENYKEQTPAHQAVFAYGVNRFFRMANKEDEEGYLTLFTDSCSLRNPIQWLISLDHKFLKKEKLVISPNEVKKLLNELLEREVDIEIEPDKVNFTEKGTKISFEQLSDGYRTVITWILDLFSRLIEIQPEVETIKDFKAIVLVDELDLFLHPKWQYTIVKKLRDKLPYIQWIFTTHSPALVMGASKDAVFYKVYKEEGETKVEQVPIDIQNINPSIIFTSPLFETPSIPISNVQFAVLQTNQSYFDLQRDLETKKYLAEKENFLEQLNKQLFNDKSK